MTRKQNALGISRDSILVRDSIPIRKTKEEPFAAIRRKLRNADPDLVDAVIDAACKAARRQTIAKLKKRP